MVYGAHWLIQGSKCSRSQGLLVSTYSNTSELVVVDLLGEIMMSISVELHNRGTLVQDGLLWGAYIIILGC